MMKYRVIQQDDRGWSHTQETSSYIDIYSIVIQAVGNDRQYIEKVEKVGDRVWIHISPGEGHAVSTLKGLKQLHVIHAEDQYLVKRKQLDQLYLLHQEIESEFRNINPDLIIHLKEGLKE
jgi:hypothetical protein